MIRSITIEVKADKYVTFADVLGWMDSAAQKHGLDKPFDTASGGDYHLLVKFGRDTWFDGHTRTCDFDLIQAAVRLYATQIKNFVPQVAIRRDRRNDRQVRVKVSQREVLS